MKRKMLRPFLTSTTSKDLKRPSIYARPTHGRCRQPLRCLSNRHCRTISITGYSMDAYVGQSGFEAAFEEYLHGTDGVPT